jgi:hypothetical protein
MTIPAPTFSFTSEIASTKCRLRSAIAFRLCERRIRMVECGVVVTVVAGKAATAAVARVARNDSAVAVGSFLASAGASRVSAVPLVPRWPRD